MQKRVWRESEGIRNEDQGIGGVVKGIEVESGIDQEYYGSWGLECGGDRGVREQER